MKYFSISPRWGSKQVGYWSGIKVFYGPRLVGFWLNLAAGDTLEHCDSSSTTNEGEACPQTLHNGI